MGHLKLVRFLFTLVEHVYFDKKNLINLSRIEDYYKTIEFKRDVFFF